MKFDSKNSIAGLPVKTARDLMRHLNVHRIDADTVLEFLNDEHWRSTVDAACKADPTIPKSLRQRCDAEDRKDYCKIWRFKFKPIKLTEAERVFATLLDEGYLEPHEPEHKFDEAKYQTSVNGQRLAAANLTPRFDRAKADKEVAALIARANEINRRDELVFFIHKITAFGSYLTDGNDLGDIDLVVEVAPRREQHIDEAHYRADNSGKTLGFMARLNYGDSEVLRLLRARKSRLSFNTRSTLDLETKFRVLFEWLPDAKRRAEMEAFDWRLHEPLRQVNEWLTSNPDINADPIEVARWCQDVAAILSKPRSQRLFRDWSDNSAHDLLSYWGVAASEAAAEKAHGMEWDEYRERVSYYISEYYKNPVTPLIETEIYAHFARGTDYMDAAILVAKHFRWRLIKERGGWVSPLQRRVQEMEGHG
ncbi:hypothetical protein [Bradyrhizobium sp. Tv2a-2]|uniref:hypothetical protein n=1 Tax=Bradyrhizobium sp. Tv2a-2 TaxID=113395 RepID=UPI00040FF31F|nr:hypothetical protein [Bradyrhizobium sp. Tv2a-2]